MPKEDSASNFHGLEWRELYTATTSVSKTRITIPLLENILRVMALVAMKKVDIELPEELMMW